MAVYETVFIIRQEQTATQVEALLKKAGEIVTGLGGTILKTENWGIRTLAYPINKARRAHYILLETDSPAEAIAELERVMRFNEDVMRYLTVRREEPSKAPSAVLNNERDLDDDLQEAA